MKVSVTFRGENKIIEVNQETNQNQLKNIIKHSFDNLPSCFDIQLKNNRHPEILANESIDTWECIIVPKDQKQARQPVENSRSSIQIINPIDPAIQLQQIIKELNIQKQFRMGSMFLRMRQTQNNIQPMFQNIQCNYCYNFPIIGNIYKCLVCPNFDLCSSCQYKHQSHPLLQISHRSHWPVSIQTTFSQQTQKYMQKQLQNQKNQEKEKRKQEYFPEEKKQQIDVNTLNTNERRGPNFIQHLIHS